jgi:hypothetical protein
VEKNKHIATPTGRMTSKKKQRNLPGPQALEVLVQSAIDVAKKAKRNGKSLTGDNFYANKLVDLRSEATNLFRELDSPTAGDTSAMAEMIETAFSPKTIPKTRTEVAKELIFALRTTWHHPDRSKKKAEESVLFPLNILSKADRGYLVAIGRQMNGAYESGWYDASAVMMRRLVEISIIEAYEAKGIASKIKDGNGNYLQLSNLIKTALAENSFSLSRNAKTYLPQLRDIGHMSAHGRYFLAQKADLDSVRTACRVVVKEFLHHAALL